MIFLCFLIGVSLVGVSARLLTRAILVPRLQLKTHLREIRDYGFDSAYEDPDVDVRERFRRSLRRTARRFGRFLIRSFPTISALSAGELNAAGYYDAETDIVHGYRGLAALTLPVLFFLLIAASGDFTFLTILLIVVSSFAGWMIPSFYVRKRGGSRMEEIDMRLPELIDLLIATVEAGMGFTASLGLVAERFSGALGEELKLTMKQQSLGMSIQGALDEMVERCNTVSVRAFARTASRGETLGVSIGPVLRELSNDQRRRHRMSAREKMQKAPVKLIFPLMFLIMPALMIVLFFPAAYTLMHAGGGVF